MSTNLIKDSSASNQKSETDHVQFVPFGIKFDGQTDIGKLFTSSTAKDADKECLVNSVRGYPLEGERLPLPPNYTGVVIETSKKGLDKDAEKDGRITNTFDTFTYWNYDRNPCKNDNYQQAIQWIEVAKALHDV